MSRGSKEFSVEDFPRGRDPITSPKDAEDTAYKHDDDAALLLSPSKTQERRHERLPAPNHLRRIAHPNAKITKILWSGLIRGLITWALIGGFYASVFEFKDRVLSPQSKSLFDAITIALSIGLGLNIASALKANALDLRWWILSFEKRPSQEVELILHCDSMTKLLTLVWVAPRPRTVIVTFFWLAINILGQISIAVVAITYQANPGIGDVYLEAGNNKIAVPDLTQFTPKDRGSAVSERFRESFGANVLGQIGGTYNFSALPAEPLKGKPFASNPAGFWNATDHWEYYFLDSAPYLTTGTQFLAVYTDRVVKSSGVCTTPEFGAEIKAPFVTVQPEDGPNVTFPSVALGLESILYLTTPFSINRTEGACGQGCSNVKVLEPIAGLAVDGSEPNESGAWFYDCNVTVTADPSLLKPLKAAQAAQAIALSGTQHREFFDTENKNDQFVSYNLGLNFGIPQNKSATGMASQISRFAIGVVSAAAQTNPTKPAQGRLPAQGVRLQFESFMAFNLILILTGSVQVFLLLATAFIASRQAIPDEAEISEGKFIRESFVLHDGYSAPLKSLAEPSVSIAALSRLERSGRES